MKPKITKVKQAPQLANLIVQKGFRSVQDVQHWAEHNGYAEVYYIESQQKVYADRTKKLVSEARRIERKSVELLEQAQAEAL